MSQTLIIDGKAIAEETRTAVAAASDTLKKAHGLTPGLAVVLVGDDPASQVYVRSKGRATREAGMMSFEVLLPEDTSEEELLAEIERLNRDTAVHGILVQLPLPKHLDENTVIQALDPAKDVDGLHPASAGLLALGRPRFVPCTPQGCMILIKRHRTSLSGLKALVVGRSILVGRPVAQLLLMADATVTISHSRTTDLAAEVAAADVVVAAVGRREFIRGEMIKPGATVIDVGINRIPAPEKGEGKTRLVGDVATEEAMGRAGAITPVPGGVGPMTVACLLRNTVLAACLQGGVAPEDIKL